MDLSAERLTQRSPAWLTRALAPSPRQAEDIPEPPSRARILFESVIRGFEKRLRQQIGIYEFTEDERCIFRMAKGKAEDDMVLSDGTHVRPGDPILDLHLWNEHLPIIPRDGPKISWGLTMHHRAIHSLRLLAAHLETEGAYPGVTALRGEAAFSSRIGRLQMLRVAQRHGFELFANPPLRRRFRFFWENFLIWGLIWTFNRFGLRGKRLMKERFELWISRAELIRRFGGARGAAAPSPDAPRQPDLEEA